MPKDDGLSTFFCKVYPTEEEISCKPIDSKNYMESNSSQKCQVDNLNLYFVLKLKDFLISIPNFIFLSFQFKKNG